MKNVKIVFLLACLSAVLCSCKKYDIAPATSLAGSGNPAKNIESPDIANQGASIGNVNTAITLTGNWSVVNDSTYSTGIGATTTGTGTNYIGQAGDHFHFTADGKVYIKEGKSIDTANYTINADKKITLNYLYCDGLPVTNYGSMIATFNQVSLTASTLQLNSNAISPGGTFFRVINLKR